MAKLLFFGRLQDVTGCSQCTQTLPDTVNTTHDLRQFLNGQYGDSEQFLDTTVRIAINDAFAQEPVGVSDTDEISFLPPVGGG